MACKTSLSAFYSREATDLTKYISTYYSEGVFAPKMILSLRSSPEMVMGHVGKAPVKQLIINKCMRPNVSEIAVAILCRDGCGCNVFSA